MHAAPQKLKRKFPGQTLVNQLIMKLDHENIYSHWQYLQEKFRPFFKFNSYFLGQVLGVVPVCNALFHFFFCHFLTPICMLFRGGDSSLNCPKFTEILRYGHAEKTHAKNKLEVLVTKSCTNV